MSGGAPQERLLARLRALGLDLPDGSRLRRLRAGRHQRAQGAWSWAAEGPNGSDLGIGSQYPMRQLLQARIAVSLLYGVGQDWHVDPVLPSEAYPDEGGRLEGRGGYAVVLVEPLR